MLHKGPAFQKRKDEKEQVSVVGDRILSYLLQNPEAQDTLDGIVDWWLFEQTLRHEKSLVEKALSVLVGQGLLIATSGMDSESIPFLVEIGERLPWYSRNSFLHGF